MVDDQLGSLEETPSPLSGVFEAVKQFGIGKLVLIIIVFAALAWFLVLAPKPAKLTVLVTELDGHDTGIGGATVSLEIPGQKEMQQFTDDNGYAIFKNVPSKVDIPVRVDPPETYQSTTKTTQLDSGTDKSQPIELARTTKLSITSSVKDLQLGAGCSTDIPVEIKNEANGSDVVELLGTDALEGLASAETKNIPPNTIQRQTVHLTAPNTPSDTTQTGSIRIRYTMQKTDISLTVTERTEANVNPDRITGRVQRGQAFKQLIEITNRARTGDIRDLSWNATGDISDFTRADFTDTFPLKPSEKKILTVVMNIPSDSPSNLIGTILVRTSCQTYPVTVELDVEQPQTS